MARQIASSDSSRVAALLARASQSLRAGRPADAIAPLRDASWIQDDHPGIQHDLGVACLEAGRLRDAVAALRRAIELDPKFAKGYFRLGMALEAQGMAPAAVEAYGRATGLMHSLTEAYFRAGNLLEVLGRGPEAIAQFQRAASSGPKTALGRLGAARAQRALNQDVEAERTLRRALALDGANPMALEMLGTLLADAGRFVEARSCFERAIAQAPLLAGSYYDLARCRPVTRDDGALVARMQAALDEPRLDAHQRLRVHLAIGKAADDLGDAALAMRHWDEADAIRRTLLGFDPGAFQKRIDTLIARFPEPIPSPPARDGHAPAPLLILGVPRSGTTLMEQILSSHPHVGSGGELPFWTAHGESWLSSGAKGEDGFLARAGSEYAQTLRAVAPEAARVTDKMPLNFLWAGVVLRACPNATIVHCRRAPIDTALSIHQTYFNVRAGLPTGGAELVEYIRGYLRLMAHWRRVLPPDRFLEVHYEALAATPEPVIRDLVERCGLAWDDACLRPEQNVRPIRTPSKWQARQPIHARGVGRWRRYEPWLGPLRALIDGSEP